MSDNKTKAEEFIKDYGELVAKYKMDFAHYPMFVPDSTGGFKVILQSTPVAINENKEAFIATE